MEKLIVVYESQNKTIDMPLYDFVKIQYENGSPFIVCNVTKEEFSSMEKQVEKGKLYELEPRLGNGDSYDRFRYLMSYGKDSDTITITDYEEKDYVGSYLLTDRTLKYVENKGDIPSNYKFYKNMGGIKIYTTKTYRDVINHYIRSTKNLEGIKTDDLRRSIREIDKCVHDLKEEKYRLLACVYENVYSKKNRI